MEYDREETSERTREIRKETLVAVGGWIEEVHTPHNTSPTRTSAILYRHYDFRVDNITQRLKKNYNKIKKQH